jgi:adenosylhomocysteine nucleosidase
MTPVAPAPVPADVGIVAALPIEVGRLFGRFQDIRKYSNDRHTVVEGLCGGKLTVLVVTGPGRAAARRGAQLLYAGHRPHWLLSAGFGGALDPSLTRNDVVLAREVADTDGLRWSIDVVIHEETKGPKFVSGRLLTVDRIVRTAREKAELRQQFSADVVDMESSGVAAFCGERGVKFLSLRVVSDDAGSDLPPEIVSILGRSGGYRVGAALGAVWRRPASLKEMWTLREHALAAADRLAEIVPEVISRLP